MKYTLIRALGFVVSLVSGAAYSQSPQADVADQFFRFVETKNKKVETPLPTVQIDRFSGTVRIVQEDMMLPGVAGLDLHLVRTYSSKIWGRAEYVVPGNMLATKDPMPSVGYGWSLHMGRLRSPNATGQGLGCGASDAPIYEAPDGSARTFYRNGIKKFISRDFWKLDQACALSSGATGVCVTSPSGQTIEFESTPFIAPGGSAGGPAFYYSVATKIRDLFGNAITIQNSVNRITEIKDSVGRIVTFSYIPCAAGTTSDNGGQCLSSISATSASAGGSSRSVSYGYTTLNGPTTVGSVRFASPGRAFLTTATTPANLTYVYDYYEASLVAENEYALKSVTYPTGGNVKFTYATRQYQTASSVPVPFAVVVGQEVTGLNLEPAPTTYDYVSDSAAGNLTSTAILPDGSKNTQVFRSFGAGTTAGNVWRVGLLASETIAPVSRPTNEVQTTSYDWDPGPEVSAMVQYAGPQYDARVGCITDPTTTSPRMTKRTVTRGGNTYGTTFSNPDPFGQPQTTIEVGERNRTTTTTYDRVEATNQILGRIASQVICYAGASSATCASTSRTFNAPQNNLGTETTQGVTTTYAYEADGSLNLKQVMKPVTNQPDIKVVMSNFIQGLPQSIDFDRAYTWSRTYYWDGALATEIDGRMNQAAYSYDAAGRIKSMTPPPGNDAILYAYPNANLYTVARGTGTSSLTESYQLDGLGRTISVTNDIGEKRLTDYDLLGRKAYESDPFLTSSTETGRRYTRDLLGRIVLTESRFRPTGHRPLAGACAATASCKVTTEFPDAWNAAAPKGHCVKTTVARAAGDLPATTGCFVSFGNPDEERLVKTTDARVKPWTYEYDVLGNLTSLVAPMAAGNRSETFDPTTFFHSSSTNGPQGTISRTFNAIGQLWTETDARAGVTTNEYGTSTSRSPLSRLTNTTYSLTPGDNTSRTYDKETLKTVSSANGGTYTYTYDSLGRLTNQTWVFLGVTYVTSWNYNTSGCLTSMMYPRGSTVTAPTCDRKGRPTALNVNGAPFVSAISYLVTGKPASMTLANGAVSTTQLIDGRMQNIKVVKGPTKIVDLTYDYDGASNVKAVTDAVTPANTVNPITYDAINRLTNATIGSTPFTYGYDDLGNRTSKAGPLGQTIFTYDPASNRLTGSTGPAVPPQIILSWNARSQLVGTSDGTSYTWDALGRRVRRTNAGLGIDVVYHYDINGALIAETDTAGSRLREYFHVANQLVAVDGCVSGFQIPCSGREFVHTDLVGSVVAKTSNSGVSTAAVRYQPWGETSSGNLVLGFNGRVLDSTGFYDFGARSYSPELGRFLSADSVWDRRFGPQASNAYSFAYNSPYNYTDKTGHCPMCIGAAIGAVTGGFLAYTDAVMHGKTGEALVVATIEGIGAGGLVGMGAGVLVEGVALAYTAFAGGAALRAEQTLEAFANGQQAAQAARSANIVLGKSLGLEQRAAAIGGTHLMDVENWQGAVRAAIADRSLKISVDIHGLEGTGSAAERVWSGITRGASGRGSPLDWELSQLYQSGRIGTVNFFENANAIPNPIK